MIIIFDWQWIHIGLSRTVLYGLICIDYPISVVSCIGWGGHMGLSVLVIGLYGISIIHSVIMV